MDEKDEEMEQLEDLIDSECDLGESGRKRIAALAREGWAEDDRTGVNVGQSQSAATTLDRRCRRWDALKKEDKAT